MRPVLLINPKPGTCAHLVGGVEQEIAKAREAGHNLVALLLDRGRGDLSHTWTVADATAEALRPLAVTESPEPDKDAA